MTGNRNASFREELEFIRKSCVNYMNWQPISDERRFWELVVRYDSLFRRTASGLGCTNLPDEPIEPIPPRTLHEVVTALLTKTPT